MPGVSLAARPVLVVTHLDDVTADLVVAQLHDRAVPVVRLDPADCPDEMGMDAYLDGSGLTGTVTTSSRELRLDQVRAVYWRRPSPWRAAAGLEGESAEWALEQTRWGLGGVLASLPGALYVNHPWRIRDAEAKVAQLATAGACGFNVPATVITTDPAVAAKFIARHGPIVYKPLWNTPWTGPDGRARTVWVRHVEPGELDDTIGTCPHLLQAAVDKVADLRITAVGRQLIAVRIDGAAGLDWRENYDQLRYTQIDTPPQIAAAISAYLERFGLTYAAFDLGLDRHGAVWWYEANANGQWAFYDDPINDQIAQALAAVLEKGTISR
ncbi:ATP-grasp ribosomal peptide maturase [Kribbella aluminosa]|uniref:ATP-grasp ribosomal peptide maturase n=1 Tax=Kribbella aluminosa TaxID=416017 RepID=A0ABS4UBC7_9ACTN|nr:ATP-grasp ribosomal peptide maturase [Kribbella aluminosa]MBP2348942.1 ATP-grasp ribosomal peptide maturase [Kribbella aluminosa]